MKTCKYALTRIPMSDVGVSIVVVLRDLEANGEIVGTGIGLQDYRQWYHIRTSSCKSAIPAPYSTILSLCSAISNHIFAQCILHQIHQPRNLPTLRANRWGAPVAELLILTTTCPSSKEGREGRAGRWTYETGMLGIKMSEYSNSDGKVLEEISLNAF
jgi:hypothetical protein